MPSALEEYSRNYGAKLRAALGGGIQSSLVEDPKAAPGQPNGRPQMGDSPLARMPPNDEGTGEGAYIPPEDPVVPMEPGGSADPEGGQDMGGPMSSPLAQGGSNEPGSAMETKKGGYTFRKMYGEAPEPVKTQQVDKLEEALKKGNETIDSAYDELVKQLGAAPEKNKKLSRQEKGMLLMEFGLNVLANNKKGFGGIGAAGGQALKSYNDMSTGPRKDYDATRGAIEGARARDKTKLATESALAGIKAREPAAGKLPGRFTGDDGNVYFYDQDGKVQPALDEAGKPIKAAAKDRLGEGGKEFESDAKYKRYMEIYGTDPRTGQPLEGLALQKVKQDALDFSNDRGRTLDDLDLDLEASKSADDFIRSQADLFRDMTPDQVNEYRNKLVKERRGGLKRPTRSYLEPNEPSRLGPRKPVRKFTSEQEAREAYRRGEIRTGDRINVNGVEDVVE
jgi:hypothetical protein